MTERPLLPSPRFSSETKMKTWLIPREDLVHLLKGLSKYEEFSALDKAVRGLGFPPFETVNLTGELSKNKLEPFLVIERHKDGEKLLVSINQAFVPLVLDVLGAYINPYRFRRNRPK